MTVDPIRSRLAAVDSWADVLALKAALTAVLDELGQAEMAAEFMETTHRLVSDMRTRRVREAIAAALGVLPVEDNQ